jgi:uncharacterized OsmC-like protein
MMTVAPSAGIALPPRRTLHCRTVTGGGFQHMNYVRTLPPIKVEEQLGVTSHGGAASPSEILLAALGSCLATRIHADAVTGSVAVQSLEVAVEADLAISPMWGLAGRDPEPLGFAAIRVTVDLQADAPPEALRALIAHAVLWSPVANTIHDPVHLDVTLAKPGSATLDGATDTED